LSNGVNLYDLEKDLFGRLSLDLIGMAKGNTCGVYIGEKPDPDGKIDRNPEDGIRSDRNHSRRGENKLPFFPISLTSVILLEMHYNYPTSWSFWHPSAMGSRKFYKLGKDLPFKRSFYYRFNDNMSSSTTRDSVLKAICFHCTHSIKSTSYMGLYIDGDRGIIPYHTIIDMEF
jgi:hypothetical protein